MANSRWTDETSVEPFVTSGVRVTQHFRKATSNQQLNVVLKVWWTWTTSHMSFNPIATGLFHLSNILNYHNTIRQRKSQVVYLNFTFLWMYFLQAMFFSLMLDFLYFQNFENESSMFYFFSQCYIQWIIYSTYTITGSCISCAVKPLFTEVSCSRHCLLPAKWISFVLQSSTNHLKLV